MAQGHTPRSVDHCQWWPCSVHERCGYIYYTVVANPSKDIDTLHTRKCSNETYVAPQHPCHPAVPFRIAQGTIIWAFELLAVVSDSATDRSMQKAELIYYRTIVDRRYLFVC